MTISDYFGFIVRLVFGLGFGLTTCAVIYLGMSHGSPLVTLCSGIVVCGMVVAFWTTFISE